MPFDNRPNRDEYTHQLLSEARKLRDAAESSEASGYDIAARSLIVQAQKNERRARDILG